MRSPNRFKNFAPALFALCILFTSCGKLQSERKPVNASNQQAFLLANGQPLTSQEFRDACQAKGSLVQNICVWVSDIKELPNNSSSQYKDIFIADLPSGVAIETTGTANNRSVEVLLNGSKLLDVPSRRTTINGGRVSWRIRPGNYYSVQMLIISCVNQANTPVRCPEF